MELWACMCRREMGTFLFSFVLFKWLFWREGELTRTVILEFVTRELRLEFEARKVEAPNTLGPPGGTAKTIYNICFLDISLCEKMEVHVYICACPCLHQIKLLPLYLCRIFHM